eukprot:1155418-Pelagomonas_calceolata.AAC.2
MGHVTNPKQAQPCSHVGHSAQMHMLQSNAHSITEHMLCSFALGHVQLNVADSPPVNLSLVRSYLVRIEKHQHFVQTERIQPKLGWCFRV